MNTIKAIRGKLKLTQQALADGIGCTQGNVWHYEQGKTVPPDMAKLLIEVARTHGLDLTLDQVYGMAPLPHVPNAPAIPKTEAEAGA